MCWYWIKNVCHVEYAISCKFDLLLIAFVCWS